MDDNNPKPQSDAQILLAHHALASEWGTLPDRVKLARAYLFTCVPDGFEEQLETIETNLASVRNDDYGRVKPEELQRVVQAIENMAYEITRRKACASKV
jgi:hypothetical protein